MQQLFTKTEAAEYANVTTNALQYAIQREFIPKPTNPVGACRKYYDRADLKKIRTHFNKDRAKAKQRAGYVSQTQAAKAVGLSYAVFNYWAHNGKFDPPSHRMPFGLATYYTPKEVAAIKAVVKKLAKNPPRPGHNPPPGYYSSMTAAKALGMPRVTLQSWQNTGRIVKPSVKVEGYRHRVYTDKDLRNIKVKMRDYFKKRAGEGGGAESGGVPE